MISPKEIYEKKRKILEAHNKYKDEHVKLLFKLEDNVAELMALFCKITAEVNSIKLPLNAFLVTCLNVASDLSNLITDHVFFSNAVQKAFGICLESGLIDLGGAKREGNS